jgi:hypothetical protein
MWLMIDTFRDFVESQWCCGTPRGVVVHSSPVGGLRGGAWGRSRGQPVRLDLHMAMRCCDSSSDSFLTSLLPRFSFM